MLVLRETLTMELFMGISTCRKWVRRRSTGLSRECWKARNTKQQNERCKSYQSYRHQTQENEVNEMKNASLPTSCGRWEWVYSQLGTFTSHGVRAMTSRSLFAKGYSVGGTTASLSTAKPITLVEGIPTISIIGGEKMGASL